MSIMIDFTGRGLGSASFSGSGEQRFDRCSVKVVEILDFVYTRKPEPGEGIDDVPRERSSRPVEDTRDYAGSGAILHCPRTEDDRILAESQYNDHGSRRKAYVSLRNQVGGLLCANCRYSQMSDIEVSEDRAKALRAEALRLEALTARKKALDELKAIDPNYGEVLY